MRINLPNHQKCSISSTPSRFPNFELKTNHLTSPKSTRYRKRYRNNHRNLVFGALTAMVWFFSPAPASAQLTCETFNYAGGLQSYTVPAGVTSIRILAAGAKGGDKTSCKGGRGAIVSGDLIVTQGEQLQIIVGGMGAGGTFDAGGGGTSFVTKGVTGFSDFTATNLMMIAGGRG